VVDRCHRFDFGRPSAEEVSIVLGRVAQQEQIDIEQDALQLIARHATGSFRDALGTLEQLVTYKSDGRIESADVLAVLGVADDELLFDAVRAIVTRDPAGALRIAAQLAESGRDPGQVLRDLERYARELLAVQILDEVPPEVRVTPERDRRLVEQAHAVSRTDAVRLLDLIAAALEATTNGAQPRIQLELVLIKAAAPEVDASRSALLARIERLEGAPPAAEPDIAPVVPPEPESAPPADLKAANELWPAVVEQLRERNAMLAGLLEKARPIAVTERELTLAFPPGADFFKRKAEQEDHRRAAAAALKTLSGRALVLRYELAEEALDDDGAPTLSGEELVRRFIEEFDAEELLDDDPEQREASH
jgi:DNA polymerase III gamma/tau subunit